MNLVSKITGLERLRNSPDGNPRYRVSTEHGTYETKADSQIGYGIENSEYRNVPVRFTLDNANRITHAAPEEVS